MIKQMMTIKLHDTPEKDDTNSVFDDASIHRTKIKMAEVHILDKIFRLGIPIIYFIFCVSYFGHYLGINTVDDIAI